MKRAIALVVLAACGGNREFRIPRLPQTNPERPGCRALLVDGKVYAVDPEGTHVLRIDPETLKSEPASATYWSGFHSFDVDDAGSWIILTTADGYNLNGKSIPADHAAILWSARCAIAWSPGRSVTFCSKRASMLVTLDAKDVRVLGVDYGRDRVWGERGGKLVSIGVADADWVAGAMEHRDPSLPSEDQEIAAIQTVAFGRDTFAFVRGGILHTGRIAGKSLRVLDRIQMPESVERIEFSSRDSNVVLVWTSSLWIWDLNSGESTHVKDATWPACVDPDRRLLITFRGSQIQTRPWN